MPYHRALRLVLLTLCGILVPAVLAGKELCLHSKPKSMGDLLLTCLPLLYCIPPLPPLKKSKYLLSYK